MSTIACTYFDGVDSTPHAATLTLVGDQLHIAGEWGTTEMPITALNIGDRLGNAPRMISFANGAACELPGGPATNAFLAQFQSKESVWFRAQFDVRWMVASVIGLVVLALAGYRWGVPLATDFIAERLPDVVVQKVSDVALSEVDRTILDPSKLPEARRTALSERFAAMKTPNGTTIAHRVEFRDAEKFVGPNAFALPSGTIVMTDQLVNLMKNDEQILGVLSHELGHVQHKHGMRNMIQASFVGAAIAYWIGDVSAVLAGGTTAILQTKFSRGYETEADDFGAAMMRANGMSPESLASALELLESEGKSSKKKVTLTVPPAEKKKRSSDGDWTDYISSHPNTTQRIERLRTQ
jgi:Zn-dependent protease with chaperone function